MCKSYLKKKNYNFLFSLKKRVSLSVLSITMKVGVGKVAQALQDMNCVSKPVLVNILKYINCQYFGL